MKHGEMFIEFGIDLFFNVVAIGFLSETHFFDYFAVEVLSSGQEGCVLNGRHRKSMAINLYGINQ